MKKEQIDFIQAIAYLLFERIEPNTKFINERVKEWCDHLPVPQVSPQGSADLKALDEINTIHEELVRIDHSNSPKGAVWPISINKAFKQKCEQLESIVANSKVHESILNLVHYHRSKMFRSQRKYTEAISEIEAASRLLRAAIDAEPAYLPKYNRNIILNKGEKSELLRLKGEVREAVSLAEEMLSDAEDHSANEAFSRLDATPGFCPVRAWALYYMCEAHLSVDDWDDKDAREHRGWAFTEAFGGGFYKKWNTPTLIKAIRNEAWLDRYPHYHSDITNIVFVGTAKSKIQKLSRKTSVYFGRVKIKPLAPAAIMSLIAVLLLSSQPEDSKEETQTTQKQESQIGLLSSAIAEIKGYPQFSGLEAESIDEVKNEVLRKMSEIRGRINVEQQIAHILMTEDQGSMKAKMFGVASVAMNGNEQGVGLG